MILQKVKGRWLTISLEKPAPQNRSLWIVWSPVDHSLETLFKIKELFLTKIAQLDILSRPNVLILESQCLTLAKTHYLHSSAMNKRNYYPWKAVARKNFVFKQIFGALASNNYWVILHFFHCYGSSMLVNSLVKKISNTKHFVQACMFLKSINLHDLDCHV